LAVVTSSGTHAALIALAVMGTASPRRADERWAERVEAVRLPPVSPPAVAERPRARPAKVGFQILQVPADVPMRVPPVDLTASITHEEDFSGRRLVGGVADLAPIRLGPPRTDPIDGAAADQSPYLLPGQMGPPYPEELRDDRPDGLVVVRFVIDTLGNVELPSLHVVASTHPLFAASVRRTLDHLRYVPASFAGRLVRVRMEQRFEFHLAAP
jgi:outer membrane biosynthesis protein TonB